MSRFRNQAGPRSARPESQSARPESQSDSGESIIYGRKPVMELLRNRPERISRLYLQSSAHFDAELKAILDSVALPKGVLEARALQELTGSERHQGLAATLKPRKELELRPFLDTLDIPNSLLVVLDQISDPQNLGSILRVCDAAGVSGVITTERRSAAVTGAVVRASAGASEFVPVVTVTNLQSTIRELKKRGFWVVGTALTPEAQPIYQSSIPEPLAVVFGSEGKGLRELTIKECDILLTIPMLGSVESLNVSQSAAVLLFELLRRREAQKRSG